MWAFLITLGCCIVPYAVLDKLILDTYCSLISAFFLQDISELFVSRSDFVDNHFTACTQGGGAISIAVGIPKLLAMIMVGISTNITPRYIAVSSHGKEIENIWNSSVG